MSQLKAIVDPLLSGVSSGYFGEGLIADQILPVIKSKLTTGKLGKYGKQHLQLELNLKGGRGAYRRVEAITRQTTSFSIVGHGLEGLVTADDYRNVQDPFDAEKDEVLGLTSLLSIEKEYLIASSLTSTANLTQNATLAAGAQFSDYLNSDPISKFSDARKAIIAGCGMKPNLAIMDVLVWDKLRFHPQMLDFLGYKIARPGGLSEDELATAMGVDKVLVAQGRYNSAKEGQTAVLSALWGKDLVFAVAPESPKPYQVSLGYMMQYEGSTPRKVYKYAVNNPPESLGILCEDSYAPIITDVGAAYLLKSVIA